MADMDYKLAGLIRRCLSMRFIVRSRDGNLFNDLLKYKRQLTEHFAPAGVDFTMHENLGVAYLRENENLEDHIEYRFGRAIRLEPLETLLLIFLRQKRQDYMTLEAERELPLITRDELRQFLGEFSDEKIDRKFEERFKKALERLKEQRILFSLDDGARFEISPVCDIVLPADRIHTYLKKAREYFSAKPAAKGATAHE